MSAAPRDNWLLSRNLDLALFGGSLAASLALLLAGAATGLLHQDLPPGLWLLAVVGVDVAHVWSTGWRVYADAAELRRRTALYLSVPAAAYAVGVVSHTLSPLLFWRLLAYAAVFHFVRQQYGWVALYRRKNGETDFRLLDSAAVYAAAVGPVVFWHANLPRRFNWFLAGDFVPGLPPAAGTAALVASGALLVAYAVKEAVFARRASVSWGKNLVVFSTALLWTLGIVVFDSDYAFAVTNVIAHGVPYVGLVWATSRRRAAERGARNEAPTLADRASARLPLFLLPLFAFAWAEEWGWDRFIWRENGAFFPGPSFAPGPALLSLLVPLLALPQATHYVLDAFIWKVRRENREAVEAVGLAVPEAA